MIFNLITKNILFVLLFIFLEFNWFIEIFPLSLLCLVISV